jgi:hypothetical protein
MTTEEKRKALDAECDKYIDCTECPHMDSHYCVEHNIAHAGASIIDKWYEDFFGKEETTHIRDSGERRVFATGAVRDIQENKGRCDLLPLDVVSNYLYNNTVLHRISEFVFHNDPLRLEIALDEFFKNNTKWSSKFTMILEVAKHFEEGAKKYGEYNWQKGIPTHCYIDSAVRHYLKWLRGDKDEPHDRAFCWNILCCIWTCKHRPELNDYAKKNKEGTTDESNTNSADT